MQIVVEQLTQYTGDHLLKKITPRAWRDVFQLIAHYVEKGEWTLYFEEVQWLANYKEDFVTELKYVWDNYFRYNTNLILILCGSSPSFVINHIVRSKALYNRSQYELPLHELNLIEAQQMLPSKYPYEVLLAYLTVGGIPEYLKRLNNDSSVLLSLCKQAFTQGGFFVHEYERIFISSLNQNVHYKKIIEFLSKYPFATRQKIMIHLKMQSGGTLTALLMDLEVCGFIIKYTPFNLKQDSLLARYAIRDNYLQFYCKFIKPIIQQIDHGQFNHRPTEALHVDTLQKWLGFSFERFCRNHHHVIARLLGFGAVRYRSGAYFSKRTNENDPGYQLDLVFDRNDHVCTVCEIKYSPTPVTTSVIAEFDKKINLFTKPKHATLHKVFITVSGADQSVINKNYFDRIITIEDLFKSTSNLF